MGIGNMTFHLSRNKSVNALVTPLFYLFYIGGFGRGFQPIRSQYFWPDLNFRTLEWNPILVFTTINIRYSLSKYFEYPSIFTQREDDQVSTFPKITVCSYQMHSQKLESTDESGTISIELNLSVDSNERKN